MKLKIKLPGDARRKVIKRGQKAPSLDMVLRTTAGVLRQKKAMGNKFGSRLDKMTSRRTVKIVLDRLGITDVKKREKIYDLIYRKLLRTKELEARKQYEGRDKIIIEINSELRNLLGRKRAQFGIEMIHVTNEIDRLETANDYIRRHPRDKKRSKE